MDPRSAPPLRPELRPELRPREPRWDADEVRDEVPDEGHGADARLPHLVPNFVWSFVLVHPASDVDEVKDEVPDEDHGIHARLPHFVPNLVCSFVLVHLFTLADGNPPPGPQNPLHALAVTPLSPQAPGHETIVGTAGERVPRGRVRGPTHRLTLHVPKPEPLTLSRPPGGIPSAASSS